MNMNQFLSQVDTSFWVRGLKLSYRLETVVKDQCIRVVTEEEIPQSMITNLIKELERKTGLANVLIYCEKKR